MGVGKVAQKMAEELAALRPQKHRGLRRMLMEYSKGFGKSELTRLMSSVSRVFTYRHRRWRVLVMQASKEPASCVSTELSETF